MLLYYFTKKFICKKEIIRKFPNFLRLSIAVDLEELTCKVIPTVKLVDILFKNVIPGIMCFKLFV